MFWLAVISFAVAILLSAVFLYKKTVERSMAPTKLERVPSPPTTSVRSLNENEGSIPSRIDLRNIELQLDTYDAYYLTPGFTQAFARERGFAAGKQAAPPKPPQQPPAGYERRWVLQVIPWMEYALSPANGLVRELIKRRGQYLANMKDSRKKKHEAYKNFLQMNVELRDKFLLPPPRNQLEFWDAVKNDDDVADFLRANNIMEIE